MSDNASDIIALLSARHLTPEEAERIILVLRQRVRYGQKPKRPESDTRAIKRGVISTP